MHVSISDDSPRPFLLFQFTKRLLLLLQYRSLREVTTFFLEQKRFQIGLEKPIKPYGVGAFTYESYLIFCCGQGRKIGTNDKALSAYCSWLRKQPLPQQGAAFAVAAIAL